MTRFPAVTILLLVAVTGVLAKGPPDEPVTVMGRNLLVRTDLVALGSVTGSTRLGAGPTVARFELRETLFSRERRPGGEVSLLSSDPTVFPPSGLLVVFFLESLSPSRFEPVGRVDVVGREGAARLETLKRYLAIEVLPDPAVRRRALHDLLLQNLASGDRFKVWSSARELAHFAGLAPETFDEEDVRVLGERAALAREPLLAELLTSALDALGAEPPSVAASEPSSRAPALPRRPTLPMPAEFGELMETWRRGGLDLEERRFLIRAACLKHLAHAGPLLLDALGDPDAEVRWNAALHLGEGLFPEAVDPLLARLAVEKDARVVEACVQSLGVLRAGKALPALIELTRVSTLLRSVAFAAARIGGPKAEAFLDELRASRSGTNDADREVRELVDFLRSEEFQEQERLLDGIRKRRRSGG